MNNTISRVFIIALLGAACVRGVVAQTETPQNRSDKGVVSVVAIEAGPRAIAGKRTPRSQQVAGVLSYAHVSMSFDEVPLKDALRTFFRALNVDYAPYYRGGHRDSGIVGDVPITLEVRDLGAHRALELLLATGEIGEKYGWQLRGGIVEVGTLARLARSGEQRSAVYEIQDLTLDVPYQPAPGMTPLIQPERQVPRELAAQLMHHITTSIHPDAWLPPNAQSDFASPPPTLNTDMPPSWANLAAFDRDENPLEVFVIGQWAKMHYHRKSLVVTAPDFVHRALNGYPNAVMPDPKKWNVPVVQPEKAPG